MSEFCYSRIRSKEVPCEVESTQILNNEEPIENRAPDERLEQGSTNDPNSSNSPSKKPFPKLPGHLYCQLCSVKSISVANHKLHLLGKRHLKTLKVASTKILFN